MDFLEVRNETKTYKTILNYCNTDKISKQIKLYEKKNDILGKVEQKFKQVPGEYGKYLTDLLFSQIGSQFLIQSKLVIRGLKNLHPRILTIKYSQLKFFLYADPKLTIDI